MAFGCTDYDAATAAPSPTSSCPDVITYEVGVDGGRAGPFNGRALADDVIDAELGLTTNSCVTSDGVVPPHTRYLSSFPYLGVPH